MIDNPRMMTSAPVQVQHIPEELRQLKQWVVWRYEVDAQDRLTKRPYQPREGVLKYASVTDPSTWGSFEEALEAVRAPGSIFSGIGIVLTEDLGIVGGDIDHCIDEQGNVAPAAQQIVDLLDSYAEVSPSGRGLRIFAKGSLPGNKGRKKGDLEFYSTGRYMTVTGEHLPESPTHVNARQEELMAVYEQVFGAHDDEGAAVTNTEERSGLVLEYPSGSLSDDDVIKLASRAANSSKFLTLWSGNITDRPSASEADLALCSLLAFYTRDFDQLDRLMQQSGLGRGKWTERADYRQRTINRALTSVTSHYAPERIVGPQLVGMRRAAEVDDGSKDDDDVPAGNGILPNEENVVASLIKRLIRAPLTDAGNAECMAALHGDGFRYCHTRKKWMKWEGSYWRADEDGVAMRAVLEVVRDRQRAWLEMPDSERRRKALGSLFSAENTPKQKAILSAAANLTQFATTIEAYDQDDWLAATWTETIELRTGELRRPEKNDLITMRLGTPYDPEATAPRWERFLEEVFGGDQELIAYIRRAVGYSLTGDTREQKMFLCHGWGANGKSKLLEVLDLLLGDYSGRAAFDTFDAGRRSEATNDLASLKGKRLVTVIETDEDRRLAEARVKAVTGQDAITCRYLYCEHFSYRPTFKLWMAVNHKPIIRGTDRGIWRRIVLIPFEQNFEGREDKVLINALRAELPGILNWALRGLAEWREQGLGTAKAIEKATEEYRRESDIMGQWFADCAASFPGKLILVSEAYTSFSGWCSAHGYREPTETSLGRWMTEKGYTRTKNRVGKRCYEGLILLPII